VGLRNSTIVTTGLVPVVYALLASARWIAGPSGQARGWPGNDGKMGEGENRFSR